MSRTRTPSSPQRDRGRSQFFTQQPFAELLVAVCADATASAADFSAGDGALLRPIQLAYPGCGLYGVDVDSRWVKSLRSTFPGGSFVCGNALLPRTLAALDLPHAGVDLVVGNPPFADVRNSNALSSAISEALGVRRPGGINVRAELAFLALALSAVRVGGNLAFVLPHTVVAGEKYLGLRKALQARHRIEAIFELPPGAFAGTEAHTYVLTLKKGAAPQTGINLYSVSDGGAIKAALRIDAPDSIQRWDYGYWEWRRKDLRRDSSEATLEELGGELFRGQLSRADAKRRRLPHFHTTDFAGLTASSVAFRWRTGRLHSLPRELRAGAGDILLPRVGTRCLGHQALVTRGSAAITDCVYRIRLPSEYRAATILSLASSFGVDWRRSNARGMCAKFITRDDILRFPVRL